MDLCAYNEVVLLLLQNFKSGKKKARTNRAFDI